MIDEPPSTDHAVTAALAQSPDLKSALSSVEQARAILLSARGGYSPAIAMLGGYGYRDRDVGGGRPEWLVGFSLEWPIVTGGGTAALVSRAQARLTQTLALVSGVVYVYVHGILAKVLIGVGADLLVAATAWNVRARSVCAT